MKISVRKFDFFSWFLVIYFFLVYLKHIDDSLRYFKYLFPFIILFIYLNDYNNKIKIKNIIIKNLFKKLLLLYFLIYIFSFILSFLNNGLTFRFFANSYFIISPILSLFLLTRFYNEKNLNQYFHILFFGSIFGFLFEQGNSLLNFFNSFSLSGLLIDSESVTESNVYPFIFAFLAIYCYFNKYSKIYLFVLLFLILLGSKRIVYLSLILIFILSFFIRFISNRWFKRNSSFISISFFLISCFIITIYFLFTDGYFDDFILQEFGVSANYLSMGRQVLYRSVLYDYNQVTFFTGLGIGEVDYRVIDYTSNRVEGEIKNLHSELLRNFVELGFILFFFWIFFKTKFIVISKLEFFIFLYFYLSILTDNIFVYFECMFTMYILLLFIRSRSNEKSRAS